ncbi:MAG: hypothetical protein EBQ99_11180, partial [Planctomycetes bacterium]|nr:hypothetical protein [Planctomycetota bacterium]
MPPTQSSPMRPSASASMPSVHTVHVGSSPSADFGARMRRASAGSVTRDGFVHGIASPALRICVTSPSP